MTDYGGLGGITEGREPNQDDKFEMMLHRVLGDQIRQNPEIGVDLWSALANIDWYHPESGDSASYSFRAAGDLIAAIIGKGDYMDWYCSGPYSTVSSLIARTLKKEGWIYDDIGMICDEPGCIDPVGCGFPTPDGYRNTCGEHMREIKRRYKDA